MPVRQWNPPAPQPQASQAVTPPVGTGPHGPGPELVGYARVSVRSQNDGSQVDALAEAGCARIFVDKGVSGKLRTRPELDACLGYLQPGDTLVITRLSRAMRSMRHLLDVAAGLRERGIGLKVLKQDIDTTSATGRFLFHILAAVDELQREIIVESTREGLEAARAKGRKGGNTFALSMEQARQAKIMREQQGEFVTDIARTFGVSRDAVYNALARLEAGETWTVNPHRRRKPPQPAG